MPAYDDPHGTGLADPYAEAGGEVPGGVRGVDLGAYCLMLGDDALVMSHRLQEWVTRAPELEEEVALANIALDLLGQARPLLSRAGAVDGSGRDEDTLAFGRGPGEFRNVRLAEAPNGDFAHAMARLLLFVTWRLALLGRLTGSRDPALAAVAAKGVKEMAYHREYAAGWVVRLGDGTAYSRERVIEGLAAVWPSTAELFAPSPVELRLAAAGVAADPASLRPDVETVLTGVLTAATVPVPAPPPPCLAPAGREGVHTPALTDLLIEMQSVARAHPGATW
ncbi:1,2-phenylacetyl-CoA epoxidase subunit PaaC [Sphaerisporangium sp. B11E5]|uniref:1,2-phenylacetyl-CoA epoxidase subunit PaaC n=1 Tax=Sphaerisporangium sp. B11E5 TaxID=3153563 RepID=UPI00325D22AC